MQDTTLALRIAAIAAAYGERLHAEPPSPRQPTIAQERYQRAAELFTSGKQCAGWDAFEAAEMAALDELATPT